MNRAEKRKLQSHSKKQDVQHQSQSTNGGASAEDILNSAINHLARGELSDAEILLQKILQLSPDQPAALHFLGLIAFQTGRIAVARDFIKKTIEVKPDYPDALSNFALVLLQLGELKSAQDSCQKALFIDPQHVEAHCNLGQSLQAQGLLDEAIKSYKNALAISPGHSSSHNNLGVIAYSQRNWRQAEAHYQEALRHNQNDIDAHCNMGVLMAEQGDYKKAESHFDRAITLNPNIARTHNNLGNFYVQTKRFTEAEKSYREAVRLDPDSEALRNLANVLILQGKSGDALEFCQKAIAKTPYDVQARLAYSTCLDRLVPAWHLPMMNDEMRNNAYYEALKASINEKSHVFEIGTGSGLLSMMAAQCGAERVVTCEMVPIVAKAAQEIVRANKMDHVISVLEKKSTNVEVGKELPRQADILVSEILSSEFLGEGVLPSIEDAKQRILKPQGQIIPSSGDIMIALFTGDEIGENVSVANVCGFDLSAFNKITPKKICLNTDRYDVQFLSDKISAFNFDFQNVDFFPAESKEIRIEATSAGKCYGVVQWVRMQMYEHGVFENCPLTKTRAAAWTHALYLFDKPVLLNKGQAVIISAAHNRISPWFSLKSA